MTTATRTYTRLLRIDGSTIFELQAGDQIDMSLDFTPVWCTVDHLGEHSDDTDIENCEGDCFKVVFFEDDDCTYALHVRESDEVYGRFACA